MKRGAVIAWIVMAGVLLAAGGAAWGDVKEECVALCRAAAKFIDEKGLDAAIAEIGSRDGKFVTKDTYVFLMDLDGNRLAHPYASPKDPGIMKLIDMKDTAGKPFVREYIEVAKTKGEGWTEYMYPTPEELAKPTPWKDKVSSRKVSFVYRVPGKNLMVIAGAFVAGAPEDGAGRRKCVEKCREAVRLIQDKGLDAAAAAINGKDSAFAWNGSYLFVVDFEGKQPANARFPRSAGMSIIGMKDKDGREVIREFIEIARTRGEGWLEYMWPKPEEMEKPADRRIFSRKASYVLRVPGKDLLVVAGVHE